jgi:hypothetical protein
VEICKGLDLTPTVSKIKLKDATELREKLDQIYENKSHVDLAQWAIGLAKHIFSLIDYDYGSVTAITEGFVTNERWQKGEAQMHDVRQAGFRVHQLARESQNPLLQTALRVAGQAIGTGHMREHAMVASDYAIRVINQKYPDNMAAVKDEREWQIKTMSSLNA